MSYLNSVRGPNNAVVLAKRGDGEGTLLVITTRDPKESPLSSSAEDLFSRASRYFEGSYGEWRRVYVVAASGSLVKMAKAYGATAVMLVGKAFSDVFIKLSGFKSVTGADAYGLLVERGGIRWIMTPPMSAYGDGSGEGRKVSWRQPSCIGFLIRHMELLRRGLPGRDTGEVITRVIATKQDFEVMRRAVERSRLVAIDTEGRNLERIHGRLITIQLCPDGRTGYVIPVEHEQSDLPAELLRQILDWFKQYLEHGRPAMHVYAHGKHDLHQFITTLGIRWYNHNVFDVALGAFCFAPETIVATEEGPMQIQELVRRPTPPRVQSFSHETGVVEYADVVGASEHSSEKDLVEIEYGSGALRVTEDHKIWSVTRGAYVEAARLLPDEEVLILPEPPAAAS